MPEKIMLKNILLLNKKGIFLNQGINSFINGPVIFVSLLLAIGFGLLLCDGKSRLKEEISFKDNLLSNNDIKNPDVKEKTMIENKWSIQYDSAINAFIVKLSGKITQRNIHECHKSFEKAIEKHCKNKKFNILLYMDQESHTLDNVRLIRSLTSTPEFQNSLNASAAVFANSPNLGINGNEGNFSNTEDAVKFLKLKNLELLKN